MKCYYIDKGYGYNILQGTEIIFLYGYTTPIAQFLGVFCFNDLNN